MSRVAKSPVEVPNGVKTILESSKLTVKGTKGTLSLDVHPTVQVDLDENTFTFSGKTIKDWAMAGTTRALVNNMVQGVSQGFEKKLHLWV